MRFRGMLARRASSTVTTRAQPADHATVGHKRPHAPTLALLDPIFEQTVSADCPSEYSDRLLCNRHFHSPTRCGDQGPFHKVTCDQPKRNGFDAVVDFRCSFADHSTHAKLTLKFASLAGHDGRRKPCIPGGKGTTISSCTSSRSERYSSSNSQRPLGGQVFRSSQSCTRSCRVRRPCSDIG